MGGGEEKHTYCCYAYRLYFLKCDMYKSSLRHTYDPVLSSLKMKGIRLLFFSKTNLLIMYKQKATVCSESHTEHLNAM
jgi:hypothetical protein